MGSSNEASQANNGLIAVLFLTQSRPGPRLLFHYPAQPEWPKSNNNQPRGGDNGKTESDSESDEDYDDNGIGGHQLNGALRVFGDAVANDFPSKPDSSSKKVLGHSVETLEKILSPGRWSDRKKFEICLDGLTFVGHPIYAGQDGRWSSKSSSARSRLGDSGPTTVHEEQNGDESSPDDYEERTKNAQITITAPEEQSQASNDFKHMPESFDDSQGGRSLAISMGSNSSTSGAGYDQMTMFHVVFAMASNRPKATEDLYQHVTKKLSKAMHYCQKQTRYVAIESRTLMNLRTKARSENLGFDAWNTQVLESSQLAWALKEVYESIDIGRVAAIRLDGFSISLQLPSGTSGSNEITAIGPHSGILLLEDKEVLLRELAGAEASPLSYFIREHTPTKSLQKHAVNLGLAINDLLYLARHLIKWCKARAITPLHQRNYYVVAPNAPLSRTAELIPDYAKRFAALPSLPQMLKILSGKPIKYVMLMPSRDHRVPYMAILAYLVRHGFVTQLKTYGWLQSTKESSRRPARASKRSSRVATPLRLLSPHRRAKDADNTSINSDRTTIQPNALAERLKSRSRSSTLSNQTALKDGHEDNPAQTVIILDPASPTMPGDAEIIQRIHDSIDDEDVESHFLSLLPYLNGECAFEEIAPREGIKRTLVERALELLEREGHLLTFRHI